MLTSSMRSDGEIRKSLHEQQVYDVEAVRLAGQSLMRYCQIQHTLQQSPNSQDTRRKAPIPAHEEEGQPAKMR